MDPILKSKLLAIALGGSVAINLTLFAAIKGQEKQHIDNLKSFKTITDFARIMVKLLERHQPELLLDPELQDFLTNFEFDKIVKQLKKGS